MSKQKSMLKTEIDNKLADKHGKYKDSDNKSVILLSRVKRR